MKFYRKPIRKQSLRPERVLFRKAWKVFSEYIRRRDKGRCCTCPTLMEWKYMQAGHFHHDVLDFDEININSQCPQCNKYYGGRLNVYASFIIRKHGLKAFEELRARASLSKKGYKYSTFMLEEIIKKYKQELTKLK